MDKPILKPLDKNLYEVVEDYSLLFNTGERITVPAGYKTNGADIPRLLWRLFPPNSPEYMPAVVVHDYLCDMADELVDKKERKQAFFEADCVFNQILRKLGVGVLKRQLFYRAVRLHHVIRN